MTKGPPPLWAMCWLCMQQLPVHQATQKQFIIDRISDLKRPLYKLWQTRGLQICSMFRPVA